MSQDRTPAPGTRRARQTAPEPWASRMVEMGMVDRGAPSITQLAARARDFTGTATPSMETVRRWVFGDRVGNIHPTVSGALAGALDVPIGTILEWVGAQAGQSTPWVPPPASARLTSEQRKAMDQLVRLFAMANGEPKDGDGGGDAPPMTVETTDTPGDGIRLRSVADPDEVGPIRGDEQSRTSGSTRRSGRRGVTQRDGKDAT